MAVVRRGLGGVVLAVADAVIICIDTQTSTGEMRNCDAVTPPTTKKKKHEITLTSRASASESVALVRRGFGGVILVVTATMFKSVRSCIGHGILATQMTDNTFTHLAVRSAVSVTFAGLALELFAGELVLEQVQVAVAQVHLAHRVLGWVIVTVAALAVTVTAAVVVVSATVAQVDRDGLLGGIIIAVGSTGTDRVNIWKQKQRRSDQVRSLINPTREIHVGSNLIFNTKRYIFGSANSPWAVFVLEAVFANSGKGGSRHESQKGCFHHLWCLWERKRNTEARRVVDFCLFDFLHVSVRHWPYRPFS